MKSLSKLFTLVLLFSQLSVNSQSIVDIVVGSPDHNTLEAAVIAADLAGTLSGPGPFTLFAPTDAAFSMIDPAVIDALLADPSGDLTTILTHHAVNGVASSDNIFDGLAISSLLGQNLTFDINGSALSVNGINISIANIQADNGVVHVIDAVLLPEITPTTIVDIVVDSPNHNTLETAVLAANLAGTLSGPGPFTLFAPTDAAFGLIDPAVIDALLSDPSGALTDILLNHAVSGVASSDNIFDGLAISSLLGQNLTFDINGGALTVNGVNISVANIEAANGVVHVIDAVLLPEVTPRTIVDIVVNSPDHNTLETAVLAAGLETALSGTGPFTLFAPTDAAFAALDPAVLNSLLADPQGALTEVLTYHALGGVAGSSLITDGLRLSTLNGQNISFSVNANGVFVNNAQIIVTDIEAENGVVHVIDAVLVPEFDMVADEPGTIVDVIVNSPDHNTLETAVLAAGLETALSGTGPFTVFAPTDAAFAAVDPAALAALLADPQGALTNVLTYHALSGVADTSNIFDGITLTTLEGSTVTISINANGAFVNNAQITVTDIRTSNGVVHVIDAVLIP